MMSIEWYRKNMIIILTTHKQFSVNKFKKVNKTLNLQLRIQLIYFFVKCP